MKGRGRKRLACILSRPSLLYRDDTVEGLSILHKLMASQGYDGTIKAFDQRGKPLPPLRRKLIERLIKDIDLRIDGKKHGKYQPPLLSPRKLADVAELLSHRTHCVFHSTEVRFLGISTRTLLYVRVGEGKDSLASSGELNTASEVLVGSVDHCLHLLIGIHES